MNKLIATTFAAATMAVAVSAALAQSADAPAPEAAAFAQAADPAAAPAGRAGQRHGGERAFRQPSERAEAHLAYVRTALKITDTQQPQWEAFANVVRKQAGAMDQRFKERRAQMGEQRGERRRPTVVERQERQRAFMAEAAQRLDERLAVMKPLYAALSPEQQRVADEVLAPRGRGGPGSRGAPGRNFHRTGYGRG
ncbi:MAG: Spy/CpxP family protein refolding chaperone [Burkholderiales bacterium]|nr:Spy/CpxP family protein refolding chaperone [Burkholderiales bacterium]